MAKPLHTSFSGDGLTHSSPPGLGPPAIRCTVWHTRFGEGKSFADGKKLYTRCPHPPTAAKMAARQGPRGAARRVEGTADHRKPGSRKAFNSFGRRRTPREARGAQGALGCRGPQDDSETSQSQVFSSKLKGGLLH